jgi:hypothetical protein
LTSPKAVRAVPPRKRRRNGGKTLGPDDRQLARLAMIRRVIAAAAAYFGLVFAAGFALGTIRVLVTAPALGEIVALLLELPIMLVVSWLACSFCLRRFGLRGLVGSAQAMGMIAFAMLIVAEVVLGLTLFGRSLAQQFATYGTPAGLLGLGGQVAFGLMPLLQSTLCDRRLRR